MTDVKRVIIDAGHGGEEPGAMYDGRREKDDTLRLALAIGRILENNGVDVVYTRTTDVYDTPLEKARIANQSGADYFVSIHRNAFPVPGTASGAMTLVYEDAGVPAMLADNIQRNLVETGFRDLGVQERPGLIVLRKTQMPAVLVEAGFIDTFRYFYPELTDAYSWWSYRFKAREKNAGWRIDYFLTSPSLKDALQDAKIHSEIMGSDHCPIELDLQLE